MHHPLWPCGATTGDKPPENRSGAAPPQGRGGKHVQVAAGAKTTSCGRPPRVRKSSASKEDHLLRRHARERPRHRGAPRDAPESRDLSGRLVRRKRRQEDGTFSNARSWKSTTRAFRAGVSEIHATFGSARMAVLAAPHDGRTRRFSRVVGLLFRGSQRKGKRLLSFRLGAIAGRV